MSRQMHVAHLPLKLSVVPTTVTRWLRVAGIPVAAFDPIGDAGHLSGEFILYDSRSAASRNSVEAVQNGQAHLIDVAPLLSMNQSTTDSTQIWQTDVTAEPTSFIQGRLFLERLKQVIDKQGGCWIRLADYPFPYQSVLCIGKIPHAEMQAASNVAFAPFPSIRNEGETDTGDSNDAEMQIARQRYAGGLPFFAPTHAAGETLFRLETPPKGFPLLWRTTFEEFLNWRRLRMQATFEVTFKNGIYHIESDVQLDRYRPQVELWRGGHLASFRLFGAGMSVREEGLVFQQEQGRHASGFSAHLLHGESLVKEQIPTQSTPNIPRSLSGA